MPDTQQLTDLTKDELHDRARERRIEGRSQMDKGELVEALGASFGEEIQLAPEEKPDTEDVTDLMEALQASVGATRSRQSA